MTVKDPPNAFRVTRRPLFWCGRVHAVFYERACQEQSSTLAASKDSFLDSWPPSPSGVACISKLPQLFPLRFLRCGSFGESCLLQLQIPAAGRYLKLCRCFGSLD